MNSERKMCRLWAAAMVLCPLGGLGTALARRLAAPDWAVRCLGLCALAGIGLLGFATSILMKKRR